MQDWLLGGEDRQRLDRFFALKIPIFILKRGMIHKFQSFNVVETAETAKDSVLGLK